MFEKEYTVNIDGLKVSGTANKILELSKIFEHAIDDCRSTQSMLITAYNSGSLSDEHLIDSIKEEERQLIKINDQLIRTIQDDEYYKQYISERNQIVAKFLAKIHHNEH